MIIMVNKERKCLNSAVLCYFTTMKNTFRFKSLAIKAFSKSFNLPITNRKGSWVQKIREILYMKGFKKECKVEW